MIKCISHKKVYPSLEIAEDALIEARTQFDYRAGTGPVAIYQCEDCGNFHLTSKGPVNPRLSQYLASGKVNKEKEANRWLSKIKNRKA